MNDSINILQIPPSHMVAMSPFVGPWLAKGIDGAERDPLVIAEDVVRDHAQVWAIFDGQRVVGGFFTSVLVSPNGNKWLDVYGLAGERILRWGKALADRMVEFARENDCDRVVFAGRKGLQKAYGGLRVIGRKDETTFIYERAA